MQEETAKTAHDLQLITAEGALEIDEIVSH